MPSDREQNAEYRAVFLIVRWRKQGGGGIGKGDRMLETRSRAVSKKRKEKKGRKKEEEEVERGKGMRQRGWSKWKAVEGKGN